MHLPDINLPTISYAQTQLVQTKRAPCRTLLGSITPSKVVDLISVLSPVQTVRGPSNERDRSHRLPHFSHALSFLTSAAHII
jgi:hypothetical protein